MAQIALAELRLSAERAVDGKPEGPPLAARDAALIRFGLASSVTALAPDAIGKAIELALHEGATPAQLQEVASLVSGLGVHSLMVTASRIAHAGGIEARPLSPAELDLWDRYVGDDPFWIGFERELPGFLAALLRLSPDQFIAFFEYCAVPWKSGTVRAQLKELIAMASDATPAHRFLPGFRIHLANAIALGASRLQIMEALDLAAQAPPHQGIR